MVVGAGQGGLTVAARLGQLGRRHPRRRAQPPGGRQLAQPVPLPGPARPGLVRPPARTCPSRPTGRSSLRRTSWPAGSRPMCRPWSSTSGPGPSSWAATTTTRPGSGRSRVRRPDGTDRTLHPHHLVLATGMSGVPNMPEIPGVDDFAGTVCHSSAHPGGREYRRPQCRRGRLLQQRPRHRAGLLRAGRRRHHGAALQHLRHEQRERHRSAVRRRLRGGWPSGGGRRHDVLVDPVPPGRRVAQTGDHGARRARRPRCSPAWRKPDSRSTSATTAAACS